VLFSGHFNLIWVVYPSSGMMKAPWKESWNNALITGYPLRRP